MRWAEPDPAIEAKIMQCLSDEGLVWKGPVCCLAVDHELTIDGIGPVYLKATFHRSCFGDMWAQKIAAADQNVQLTSKTGSPILLIEYNRIGIEGPVDHWSEAFEAQVGLIVDMMVIKKGKFSFRKPDMAFWAGDGISRHAAFWKRLAKDNLLSPQLKLPFGDDE